MRGSIDVAAVNNRHIYGVVAQAHNPAKGTQYPVVRRSYERQAVMDVKALRLAAELTQEDLAERMGVSQSTVAQWESGRRTPNDAYMALLGQILGQKQPQAVHDQYLNAPTGVEARQSWNEIRQRAFQDGRVKFSASGVEGKMGKG